MQNTKAAGVRLQPLLAYSLRSLRGDRNGNGEGGGKAIHLAMA